VSRSRHAGWRQAPIYPRAHDLAVWLLARTAGWSAPARAQVGAPLDAAARALVCALSLALTFPEERLRRVKEADRALVRLRVMLRMARDLDHLDARQARYAHDELLIVGRMLGGWRKALRQRPPPAPDTDFVPPGEAPFSATTG